MKVKITVILVLLFSLLTLSCKKDENNPIQPPATDLTTGLVAYYPFNGNANDESGNAHHGIIYGALSAIDRFGVANKAYHFNGINDSIVVPSNSNLTLSKIFSVAIWIKSDTSNRFQNIINKRQGFNCDLELRVNQWINGIDFNKHGCATLLTSKTAQPHTWNFIVATFQDSAAKLYLNGSLDTSFAHVSAFGASLSNIIIGNAWNGSTPFKGTLDDIRIYNRALADAEIKLLYNEGGWTGIQDGLVAYYPFNGNANDESWNGNNGTVTNATLTADRFGNINKAYSFDGVSAYISFTSLFILHQQTNATVLFWSYHESGNAQRTLFFTRSDEVDNNRFHICYDSTNAGDSLRFNYRETNSTMHAEMWTTLGRGVWIHLAIVHNGNSYLLYKNGVLTSQSVDPSPVLPTTTGWRLAGKNSYGYRFKGRIDDIRFYGRALSQSEIQSLYHEGGW
jgi:hypothetical protein